jgi:lysozyme
MKYIHRYTNSNGIELIKFFEGFRDSPYICAAGYPTIGFGHKILSHENFKQVSLNDAENLLKQDLYIAERSVLRHISTILNNNQFAALVSFTFNLGGAALQRSTLRQKINYDLNEDSSNEFLRWIYAGGKILPGLVKRRKAEQNLFMSGFKTGKIN